MACTPKVQEFLAKEVLLNPCHNTTIFRPIIWGVRTNPCTNKGQLAHETKFHLGEKELLLLLTSLRA